MAISTLGPYQTCDIFEYGVQFVDAKDIFSLAQVCKKYSIWSQSCELWKKISEREGIPLVANSDGTPRVNPKNDFRILYPITLSSKIIGQFLGKVVGSVPPIRQFWFDKLNQPDPYEPQKLGRDNYVVVVEPSCLERAVDKDTPLDIDVSGSLIENRADMVRKRTLTIPLSLKNLYDLSSYPLYGKKHSPIFDPASWYEGLKQCTSFPERVGVYFMRRSIIGIPWDSTYVSQQDPVTVLKEDFTVTPLRIRALADSLFIFRSGTCPDGRDNQQRIYARTSDTFTSNNSIIRLGLGGYAPDKGVCIRTSYSGFDRIGVVPGGSAQVPSQKAVGHLASVASP